MQRSHALHRERTAICGNDMCYDSRCAVGYAVGYAGDYTGGYTVGYAPMLELMGRSARRLRRGSCLVQRGGQSARLKRTTSTRDIFLSCATAATHISFFLRLRMRMLRNQLVLECACQQPGGATLQ